MLLHRRGGYVIGNSGSEIGHNLVFSQLDDQQLAVTNLHARTSEDTRKWQLNVRRDLRIKYLNELFDYIWKFNHISFK